MNDKNKKANRTQFLFKNICSIDFKKKKKKVYENWFLTAYLRKSLWRALVDTNNKQFLLDIFESDKYNGIQLNCRYSKMLFSNGCREENLI